MTPRLLTCALGFSVLAGTCASAEVRLEETPLGPPVQSLGCAISPRGDHVAVLAARGSRFVVLVDGVEGPAFDALLPSYMGRPVPIPPYWIGKIPVVFSGGGEHCAYVVKIGSDCAVILDGKELARGPIVAPPPGTMPLTLAPLLFTSDGTHLLYVEQEATGRFNVCVDGKPGPSSRFQPQVVVSTAGDHYAYIGYETNGADPWAVVDGSKVAYFGNRLQYTTKGGLFSQNRVGRNAVLLLDGTEKARANRIDPMWMAPDGSQVANVITKVIGEPTVLTVNGEPVAGTEGLVVDQVYFSADGKRYAALCRTSAGAKFMIVDGKKGREFQDIAKSVSLNANFYHWRFVIGNDVVGATNAQPGVPGFTADSTKFVYIGQQGGQAFMEVDDVESSGFLFNLSPAPVISATGHRVGVIGTTPDQKQHVVIDGADHEFPAIVGGGNVSQEMVSTLSFSPGAVHSAYAVGTTLYIDDVAQPGTMVRGRYVFSPDDQHFAYVATIAGRPGLIIDGRTVASDIGTVDFAFFSPDSRHIIWVKSGRYIRGANPDVQALYVDGVQITEFADNGLGANVSLNYEFTADGMTFVARKGGVLKRFHLSLAPESGVQALVAGAPPASGK